MKKKRRTLTFFGGKFWRAAFNVMPHVRMSSVAPSVRRLPPYPQCHTALA